MNDNTQFAIILLDNYFATHNIAKFNRYEEYHKLLDRYHTKNIVDLVHYLKQDYVIPFEASDFAEWQIKRIKKLVETGGDVFTIIRNSKFDVTPLLNPKFDERQFEIIANALKENIDSKTFDVFPLIWYVQPPKVPNYCIDVKSYADPKYTADEMYSMLQKLIGVKQWFIS